MFFDEFLLRSNMPVEPPQLPIGKVGRNIGAIQSGLRVIESSTHSLKETGIGNGCDLSSPSKEAGF